MTESEDAGSAASGPDSSDREERVLAEALRAQARVDADGSPPASTQAATDATRAKPALPARWVLLLAVLLGLAAGSVVGLLSLL